MRHIILFRGDDNYFIAQYPVFDGCFSQGKTETEAIANLKEAIELWIEDAHANGEEVPEDRPLRLVAVDGTP